MAKRILSHAVLAVSLISPWMVGCETTPRGKAAIDLKPSTHNIYAGEIVTVMTRSRNTLGKDARVEWSANGGKLETIDNNRVARVQFDQPGSYKVQAKLYVGNDLQDTEEVKIDVKPIQ